MSRNSAIAYNDGNQNMIGFSGTRDGKFIVCPTCKRKTPTNSGRDEDDYHRFPRFTQTKHDPGCAVGAKARSPKARALHS